MRKRIASIVLSICLCFTLLPTAALAEGTTPATGIYFAQENGTPSGDCTVASERSGFGDDGKKTLTGYWDIPYTAGTALTVYYYNAAAKELTSRNNSYIQIEKVGGADHLWGITLSSGASKNEEWVDLNYTLNDGDGSFVMTFKRTASVPTEGLYYKYLTENRENGSIDEKGAFIKLDKLEMAPFVDRIGIALYYHDGKNGSDYTPVNRVRLPFGSGFDMVWVRDWMWDDNLPAHWYYLSAYDFSESQLSYYTGGNAEPSGSVKLNSHQLPPVAFYASAEGNKPSKDAYRMYTVMEQAPVGSSYKYTTTLYLRSANGTVDFADGVCKDEADASKNTTKCFQKHYDRNGMENANDPETVYNSYDVAVERIEGGKALKVTVYANDSDLLLWLYGPEDDQYAAYVNLLAPDKTQIRLNDQGFEAAKYLPKHLFWQLKEMNLPITLSAGDYAADITCNAALTAAIADAENATLTVDWVDEDGVMDAVSQENSSADFVGAVGITLAYGGKAQHTFTDGATATISYPCELDLADGETVLVYYVYTEDGEVKTEQIEAVYDAAAKCVTFTTTHFSTFVIVKVPAPASAPGTSGGSSDPTYSVTVHKADHGTVKANHRYAEQGDTVTVTVTPDEGYTLDNLTVFDKNGKKIEVTDKGNGKYTFQMPACKVTVEATFTEDNTELPFFADVPANTYYYDAVLWAAKNGVTGGVDENHFAPDRPCTRAQIVTFLWRAAGSPAPTRVSSFADVPADAYYVNAAAWAVENGITTGVTTDTFCPDRTCTRAQAVAFLFRYAASQGMAAVTLQELVSSHADAASVPGYAISAFNWALANGIVNGNDGNLMPNNDCTRAQIVTMLHRLLGTN